MIVSPSILSAEFTNMAAGASLLERSGADRIHCDVMDGVFVPNITFGQDMVRGLRAVTSLPLDVHLMTEKPERHIESFAGAGADFITVHAEACVHLHRTLQAIKDLGCGCGVALNPSTPADAVEYVLGLADIVLVMTVNPGFAGQAFIPGMTAKIEKIAAMIEGGGHSAELAADGGIGGSNIGLLSRAGVRSVVSGSYVFSSPDPAAAIGLLRRG